MNLNGSKIFVSTWRNTISLLFAEFKKLNPTFFEFNYICLIALWSFHDSPQLNLSTKQLGDKIIEDASLRLHNYYVKELRHSDYAGRQAKLFKIANMTAKIIESEKELVQAMKIFNFAPNEFSFCEFTINYYMYLN